MERPVIAITTYVTQAGHRFALGVLSHPDGGEDLRLFEELVRAGR